MMTPRNKLAGTILAGIRCLECHIETDIAGQFKKRERIRTEPHQGSWVNSPIYKGKASKGNRQNR